MGNRNFQRIYKVASNSTSGSEGRYMIQELVGEDDAHSVLFFQYGKERVGLRLNSNIQSRIQQKQCRKSIDKITGVRKRCTA